MPPSWPNAGLAACARTLAPKVATVPGATTMPPWMETSPRTSMTVPLGTTSVPFGLMVRLLSSTVAGGTAVQSTGESMTRSPPTAVP